MNFVSVTVRQETTGGLASLGQLVSTGATSAVITDTGNSLIIIGMNMPVLRRIALTVVSSPNQLEQDQESLVELIDNDDFRAATELGLAQLERGETETVEELKRRLGEV